MDHMSDWWMPGFGWIFIVLFWVLVILAIVVLLITYVPALTLQ